MTWYRPHRQLYSFIMFRTLYCIQDMLRVDIRVNLGSVIVISMYWIINIHHDVIKWKHFPCYWPFVRGIHRSPVKSPHKGQWRGALVFSSICVWINGWVNNREAGDLRRHRTHYDVNVMITKDHRTCHHHMCMNWTETGFFLENIHAISVIWVRWPYICSLCQGFSFRIIKYRTLANRMSNYNVFIASSFNYFNVVWHFCSNRSLYRLEKLHKQGRRVFPNDYASHCLNIWIQMKNARQMQILILSMWCWALSSNNAIWEGVRNAEQPKVNTTSSGLYSFMYQVAKLWNEMLSFIKEATSLVNFKYFCRDGHGPNAIVALVFCIKYAMCR